MKRGDTVTVLGVLDDNGRPELCTLEAWHPSPRATDRATPGEWDYESVSGKRGSRAPDEIFPVDVS